MTTAAVAANDSAGTSPTWWKGERPEQPVRCLEEASEHLPHEGDGDEAVRDGGRAPRDEREPERSETEEEQRDGQAVGAGLEQSRERDVGALGGGADPGEHAAGEGEHRGSRGRQQQPPGEPAAAPDGEGEERLEPLLRLFLALQLRAGSRRTG